MRPTSAPGPDTVPRVHLEDPAPLLEAAFRRVARERMDGVDIVNPRLTVEAVGFARRDGHWLGIVVTPWFMNVVRVPGQAEGWRPAVEGERVFHRLAAGDFAFLGGSEPEVGEFQSCSLISPMAGFTDQASARATAREALHLLDTPSPSVLPAAISPSQPAVTPQPAPPADPSRRSLLFGRRRPLTSGS